MEKRILGFDLGTGNLVSGERNNEGSVEINSMRNMFLTVDPDILKSYDISSTNIDYIEQLDDDGEVENIHILGEDAYVYANMFNKTIRRPMQKGVMSSSDIDAVDVIRHMIEKMVGKSKDGFLVYSVPAQSIDEDIPPVFYHEQVFARIFKSLGYEAKSLNEAMAIIFAECAETNFTGIAISFGCGLTNIAVSYKGMPIMSFSINRGGDWIDRNVSESTGVLQSRATAVKEKDDMDLMNPLIGNKKTRQVREAISFFYSNLIDYCIEKIIFKIKETSDDLEIEEEIPIIISGGTSLPKGFVDLFKERFSEYKDFPYNISDIRHAKDPLSAVAQGGLIYAHWLKNKENKENDSTKNNEVNNKKKKVLKNE